MFFSRSLNYVFSITFARLSNNALKHDLITPNFKDNKELFSNYHE